MARNLELKVRCEGGLARVRASALAIGVNEFSELQQRDTYFVVPNGRLKLREIEPETGEHQAELIAYQRPDDAGSRWSEYLLTQVSVEQCESLKRSLTLACGVVVVVVKRRAVGIWRHTRIHLDTVEQLGCFVELETVMDPAGLESDARDEHEQAILSLGLTGMPVVSGSYSDLAIARAHESRASHDGKGSEP